MSEFILKIKNKRKLYYWLEFDNIKRK